MNGAMKAMKAAAKAIPNAKAAAMKPRCIMASPVKKIKACPKVIGKFYTKEWNDEYTGP